MSDSTNEIKIKGDTRLGGALRHIHGLLVTDKKFDRVIVRAAGQAIPVLVGLAELVRHRIKGIH